MDHLMSFYLIAKRMTLILCAFVLFGSGGGNAEEYKEFSIGKSGGFSTHAEGEWAADGNAHLESRKEIEPGWYTFDIEYKTEGFGVMGNFAAEVRDIDRKQRFSPWEIYPGQDSWSPLRIFVHVTSKSRLSIRFCDRKDTEGNTRLFVRNPRLNSFSWEAGEDVLPNGAFSEGTPGQLPAQWRWKYNSGNDGDYGLVKNESFREGPYVLRIRSDKEKSRTVISRKIPLPAKGMLEFSVWARGVSAGADVGLMVICDGWKHRKEVSVKLANTWKKHTLTLPVPDSPAGEYLWVRMNVSKGQHEAEFADAKLVLATEKPEEATAMELGWLGAPGPNMIFNPDMELGGAGYLYGFTWCRDMRGAKALYDATPAGFLVGKGVDGGTCMYLTSSPVSSYCFPVETGKTYTFSVDLRAPEGVKSADASILVLDPDWKSALWKKVGGISGKEWKRYSWTINWKDYNSKKKAYFRLGSKSGVLVDRLQAVEGTESEYQAPPVMVGMVADRWPYFMRGRDEARMQIKVVPGIRSEGVTKVDVVAVDAWGRESWKETLDAPLDKITLKSVDLPTERLGTYHVELRASIDGKVAGMGEARYAIIDKPATDPTSPDRIGLFGICQETFNFPAWICSDHVRIQKDLGVRLNRSFASVPKDMPLPIPAELASDLQKKCKPYKEAGIEMMLCVNLINPLHTEVATVDMPSEDQLNRYGKFIGEYVGALKSDVGYWEIMNETNLWRVTVGPNKGKPKMYPEKYAEFQKVAYKIIKGLNGEAKVVCNAMNNIDLDWLDKWMKAGGKDYMDVMSYHPYAWTNAYDAIMGLKKRLAQHGFTGPVVNSEKYFGCDLFFGRIGHEETRRGYFLPHNGELGTAGRSMRLLISQAAAESPACFFSPGATLFGRGPGDALVVYDFFSAYNAATRFLVSAGPGHEIEMGPSTTVFVFPEAKDGPLMVMWTPQEDIVASMRGVKGEYSVYDIMGNKLTEEEVANGLRVASDPIYVRFAKGTDEKDIVSALNAAEVVGLGDPLLLNLSISGSNKLKVGLLNCRNKPLDGIVNLQKFPEGWSPVSTEKNFAGISVGGQQDVEFEFAQMPLKNLGRYSITVMARVKDEFVRREIELKPIMADRIVNIVADGDLSEWKGCSNLMLNDDNLSKDFNGALKHTGEDDLSARIACGWNDKIFALAFIVKDDVDFPVAEEGRGWKGDSIQLYFDPKGDNLEGVSREGDDVHYTVSMSNGKPVAWLEKGAAGNYKGAANDAEDFNDIDVEVAIVRNGNNTIYEIVMPVKKCLPDAVMEAGKYFGFSLLINDNDGKGRKVGLTLAPRGEEPCAASHKYMDMVLCK